MALVTTKPKRKFSVPSGMIRKKDLHGQTISELIQLVMKMIMLIINVYNKKNEILGRSYFAIKKVNRPKINNETLTTLLNHNFIIISI